MIWCDVASGNPKVRYGKWTWEEVSGFEELPISDLDRVRRTLLFIRASSLPDPLGFFFREVLLPYYDCMFEGLNQQASFVIYRLSDKVPVELRRALDIYPQGDNGYATLEDWREDFVGTLKRGETDIPHFYGETPEVGW